jgi:serine/threonine-protein kinase RsbW
MTWTERPVEDSPKRRHKLTEEVLDAMRARDYPDGALFSVQLALEEAMINAICHGNKMNNSKKLVLRYDVDDERVMVQVEDQGRGFDYKNLPDPCAPENLERPAGRGVMLMRTYMDSVEYSHGGCVVTMAKYRH